LGGRGVATAATWCDSRWHILCCRVAAAATSWHKLCWGHVLGAVATATAAAATWHKLCWGHCLNAAATAAAWHKLCRGHVLCAVAAAAAAAAWHKLCRWHSLRWWDGTLHRYGLSWGHGLGGRQVVSCVVSSTAADLSMNSAVGAAVFPACVMFAYMCSCIEKLQN
jgi:hypothetical protein